MMPAASPQRLPRYLEVLERLALYAYRRQMYAGILRLGLRENNVTTSGLSRPPLVRGVGFVDLVRTPLWSVT